MPIAQSAPTGEHGGSHGERGPSDGPQETSGPRPLLATRHRRQNPLADQSRVPMASRAGAAGRLSARTIRKAEKDYYIHYGLLGLSGGRRGAAGTSTFFLQRVVLCPPPTPPKRRSIRPRPRTRPGCGPTQGGVSWRSLWPPPPLLCAREPPVMTTRPGYAHGAPYYAYGQPYYAYSTAFFFGPLFFFEKKRPEI